MNSYPIQGLVNYKCLAISRKLRRSNMKWIFNCECNAVDCVQSKGGRVENYSDVVVKHSFESLHFRCADIGQWLELLFKSEFDVHQRWMDDCESDLLHCFCQLGMASSPALTARIEWGSQANGIRIQPGVKSDLGLKYKVNKSTGAAWYCIPGGPESWIFRFSITRLNDLQICPAWTDWTNQRAVWKLLDQSEARNPAEIKSKARRSGQGSRLRKRAPH